LVLNQAIPQRPLVYLTGTFHPGQMVHRQQSVGRLHSVTYTPPQNAKPPKTHRRDGSHKKEESSAKTKGFPSNNRSPGCGPFFQIEPNSSTREEIEIIGAANPNRGVGRSRKPSCKEAKYQAQARNRGHGWPCAREWRQAGAFPPTPTPTSSQFIQK
jgi:hypothetical protein